MQTSPELPEISDQFMMENLARTRSYTVVVLKKGPAYDPPNSDRIIWEHGRRNFALRAAGVMHVVCPISDGTEMAGIGIFSAEPAQVEAILSGDPAIQAGVLTSEVHASRSFPGDSLPAETR